MTSEDGFKIAAPDGRRISIPVAVEAGLDPYPLPENPGALRDFYDRYGYVVVRGLVPEALCEAVLDAYRREVKPYDGFLYRQPSSGRAEKHVFSQDGHLLNSILNLQDLDPRNFQAFRAAGLEVFSDARLQNVVSALLGESAVLVQSMFFEGNPVTWAHQDTYYLDSTAIGRLVAAWIALEDIRPGAGRFYIYPKSHKIDLVRHGGDFDIAFNHERYKALILKVIEEHKLDCHAPAMQVGDVLFWNSRTIHGSLETTQPEYSRCSLTAHFIPASTGLLQFQRRVMKLHLEKLGELVVHHPKDQRLAKNRLVLALESRFPRVYGLLRNLAIKLLTR